jgi:hypothetical protein
MLSSKAADLPEKYRPLHTIAKFENFSKSKIWE